MRITRRRPFHRLGHNRGLVAVWDQHVATFSCSQSSPSGAASTSWVSQPAGWLEEAAPNIACPQELKAPDDKFPAAAIRAAGYGAVWHGQKSWNGVAILARGAEPVETRRELPGDPDNAHSRYIEAAAGGLIIGCLYPAERQSGAGPEI